MIEKKTIQEIIVEHNRIMATLDISSGKNAYHNHKNKVWISADSIKKCKTGTNDNKITKTITKYYLVPVNEVD